MSGKRYGIATNAITWEKEESEISQESTGRTVITVTGSVGVSDTPTALADAMELLPTTIPVTDEGPIGASTQYSGARIASRSARYLGDDTIQVTATYEIAVPENTVQFPDNGGDTSDSDRVNRSVVTEQAPILTHPVVRLFPETDRRLLSALLDGEIRVNATFDSAGSGNQLWEFVRNKLPPNEDEVEEVTFDAAEVSTLDGVTSSPIAYARLIASGVTVWERPTIRMTVNKSRNEPTTDADFGRVGEAVDAPENAPFGATPPQDRQWFLKGITDSSENLTAWNAQYDYELSGVKGVLKALYPGGDAVIQ